MAKNNDLLIADLVLLRQAEERCRQRLLSEPDNLAALRSLAEVHRKLGNLGEAADVYDRLLRLDPADREAEYLKALLGGKERPQPPSGTCAAPFALLKDFLAPEFHDSLLPFIESVRDRFVPMKGGNKEYQSGHRQALEFPDPWEGKQRFRTCLAKVLPEAIGRLNLPEFQVGPIEVCIRAYQDGNFFKVHQDSAPSGPYASRIINFVYYFHKQPRPFTGGDLLLFDTDIQADSHELGRFTRIVPHDNSLIIFPCNFYHSVVPIRCPSQDFADSRFVINGHVRKRGEDRPAVEEVALSLPAPVES
jgi:Rps23 Pro-64 3,4-dihydroxylase Tpa1-like proline 4-hydroxylase